VSEPEEDGEAHTLGLLKELRALAEEIGHGHMDYAHKFHELLQTIKNPNLPDVAKDFGFRVLSCNEFGGTGRTIAASTFPPAVTTQPNSGSHENQPKLSVVYLARTVTRCCSTCL